MFEVGQRVVCINSDPRPGGKPTHLHRGRTYTVASIILECWDGPGITLAELAIPYRGKLGWLAERFRPLQERKTNISVFTEILNKQPSLTDA